jgi:hypothetical protein
MMLTQAPSTNAGMNYKPKLVAGGFITTPLLNLIMARNSDLENSDDFDYNDSATSDSISDDEEDDPNRLIPDDPNRLITGFSDHKTSEANIHLSAYGKSSYALVLDERCLVIYDPKTRSTEASYNLDERLGTFTSVIASEDDCDRLVPSRCSVPRWNLGGSSAFWELLETSRTQHY